MQKRMQRKTQGRRRTIGIPDVGGKEVPEFVFVFSGFEVEVLVWHFPSHHDPCIFLPSARHPPGGGQSLTRAEGTQ
jgi:hypothetical protein